MIEERAILAALERIARMQDSIRSGMDICRDTGLVFLWAVSEPCAVDIHRPHDLCGGCVARQLLAKALPILRRTFRGGCARDLRHVLCV